MTPTLARLEALWTQSSAIWIAGGWCMVPIALTALVMFGLGVDLWLRVRGKGFLALPEATWREWITDRSCRRGPVGALLDLVGGARTMKALGAAFGEVRAAELTSLARDLVVMKVCIAAAPLLGLLGTVTGMLATFAALASGSGGEETMALVAKGIAEALITTETGLIVALPGLFFRYQLTRKVERYRAFLAHLETVCTQSLHRRLQAARAS